MLLMKVLSKTQKKGEQMDKPRTNIKFASPCLTKEDREAVNDAMMQERLTDGLQCRKFELDFFRYIKGITDPTTILANNNVLATSSCMGALHLAYLSLGIGEGDDVLCPAMSHVATAHAIELVGARPVFMDCGVHGNIRPQDIEEYITPNTKAITLVHFLGRPCRMDSIMAIAKDYGLFIIEDCALALGSIYEGKHVGLWGDVGAFSFYPAKHITTGEGGMFVTKHEWLYREARKLSRFGKVTDYNTLYNIDSLGLNYRMNEMAAALGRSQLKRINQNLEIRNRNAQLYKKVILGMWSNIIIGSYAVSIDIGKSRDSFILKLKNKGIESSIYYPHPIPRLTYYKNKYGWRKKLFPNAIKIADETIALPVASHITEEDILYIVEWVKEGSYISR